MWFVLVFSHVKLGSCPSASSVSPVICDGLATLACTAGSYLSTQNLTSDAVTIKPICQVCPKVLIQNVPVYQLFNCTHVLINKSSNVVNRFLKYVWISANCDTWLQQGGDCSTGCSCPQISKAFGRRFQKWTFQSSEVSSCPPGTSP